ncbi:MAG: MMPL family transporter [Planctomycetaceae bacterium]|nr:MMPL family transporter [Planctomycetaceae bacterium]
MGLYAPPFSEVAVYGEFDFLPQDVPSRQAEELYRQAFDKDLLRSLLVVCLRRTTRAEGLTANSDFGEQDRDRKSDYDFIDNDLRPALQNILKTFELGEHANGQIPSEATPFADSAVTTFSDKLLGPLLISRDKKASLVFVELPNDFMDVRNAYLLDEIESLLYENAEFRSIIPPGLEITLGGTATVGRDMNRAALDSAKATEKVTIIMVISLLLLIYRAPLLAFTPLLTVVLVMHVTLGTIAYLASWQIMGTFQAMDIYILVVVYGAGVDYCLFLIARYREELEKGVPYDQAVSNSLRYTLTPLICSAGTSVIGIGMMIFTSHRKFQEVGQGISLGLVIALLGSITLAPALLRLFGRWSFWPNLPVEQPGSTPGWISRSSMMERLLSMNLIDSFWKRMAGSLAAYPGWLWLGVTGLMLPFVIIACLNFNFLSYGLLSELPEESRSVVGTRAVQAHFQAGTLGPTTVLLVNESLNFLQEDQVQFVRALCQELFSHKDELELTDIFCSAFPLGMTEEGQQRQAELDADLAGNTTLKIARRAGLRARVMKQYVGNKVPLGPHVTRIDLVFAHDPFHANSIALLENALRELNSLVPQFLPGETRVHALGSTASIRDMKLTTDHDQIVISYLVLIGVYLILVLLLRKPAVSAYLILSVFFSYLATLGVTFVVFWAMDPVNFSGIDWKVRMFLFTMLIAIGEDYNIFLVARIDEERARANSVKGVLLALMKTGGIISSCGLIMAATFCSLMAGSLEGMQQLGFALAFGVLLDTFVVRTILVPAYLILLERGLLGRYSRWFGAVGERPASPEQPGAS